MWSRAWLAPASPFPPSIPQSSSAQNHWLNAAWALASQKRGQLVPLVTLCWDPDQRGPGPSIERKAPTLHPSDFLSQVIPSIWLQACVSTTVRALFGVRQAQAAAIRMVFLIICLVFSIMGDIRRVAGSTVPWSVSCWRLTSCLTVVNMHKLPEFFTLPWYPPSSWNAAVMRLVYSKFNDHHDHRQEAQFHYWHNNVYCGGCLWGLVFCKVWKQLLSPQHFDFWQVWIWAQVGCKFSGVERADGLHEVQLGNSYSMTMSKFTLTNLGSATSFWEQATGVLTLAEAHFLYWKLGVNRSIKYKWIKFLIYIEISMSLLF